MRAQDNLGKCHCVQHPRVETIATRLMEAVSARCVWCCGCAAVVLVRCCCRMVCFCARVLECLHSLWQRFTTIYPHCASSSGTNHLLQGISPSCVEKVRQVVWW